MLLMVFTSMLIKFESKVVLSVAILLMSALMSAFLDALSVAAVIVSVASGVLGVYYRVVENTKLPMLDKLHHDTMTYELIPQAPKARKAHLTEEEVTNILDNHAEHKGDSIVVGKNAPASDSMKIQAASVPQSPRKSLIRSSSPDFHSSPSSAAGGVEKIVEPTNAEAYGLHKEDIAQFRLFLKSLLLHSAVGTALGGCMTLVGEPQNIVIARYCDWDFVTYFMKMLPVSLVVLPVGTMTCMVVESTGSFGYGTEMPEHVRKVLNEFVEAEYGKLGAIEKAELSVQVAASVLLVLGLAFHVTEVGFVGLASESVFSTLLL